MKIRAKAVIPADPETVFDFVADMRNDPQWAPMVKGVEQVGGEGPGQGASYVIQQAVGSRTIEMPIRITHYERPTRLEWEMDHKSMEYTSVMTFAPHKDGTQVHQTNTEEWTFAPWWLKLLAPAMIKRQMRKQHALLAKAIKG